MHFIDTGLLRKNEVKEVENIAKSLKINLKIIDSSKIFSGAAGITDPEKKRKIIGKCFIDVFEQQAKKIKGAKYLGQGTIYPDIIESHPQDMQNQML